MSDGYPGMANVFSKLCHLVSNPRGHFLVVSLSPRREVKPAVDLLASSTKRWYTHFLAQQLCYPLLPRSIPFHHPGLLPRSCVHGGCRAAHRSCLRRRGPWEHARRDLEESRSHRPSISRLNVDTSRGWLFRSMPRSARCWVPPPKPKPAAPPRSPSPSCLAGGRQRQLPVAGAAAMRGVILPPIRLQAEVAAQTPSPWVRCLYLRKVRQPWRPRR